MNKTNKILISIIIVLLIILIAVIYWQKGGFERPYSAVYLSTGDIYFGKLTYFPHLQLTDVWFLQKDPSNQQAPFSLVKFDQAFWGPQDKLILNKKDIIWITELKNDSAIVQTIKNQKTRTNTNIQTPSSVQNPTANEGSSSTTSTPSKPSNQQ